MFILPLLHIQEILAIKSVSIELQECFTHEHNQANFNCTKLGVAIDKVLNISSAADNQTKDLDDIPFFEHYLSLRLFRSLL